MKIPALILRQLYTFGSLANTVGGARFQLKNRLSDARLRRLRGLRLDDEELAPADVRLVLEDGREFGADGLPDELPFALRDTVTVIAEGRELAPGQHRIGVDMEVAPYGRLRFEVTDAIAEQRSQRPRIPSRRGADDYDGEVVAARQRFAEEFSGSSLRHVASYSFDPALLQGNVEGFVGVAQVPIGLAGPLRINGEHARGEFLVPLATTEGTLVASYNRGMKVLNLAGGVTCTVQDDCMQRAPVFVFDSAREARAFRDWVDDHIAEIREAAEATTSVGKLLFVDTYLSNKFAYLRFNFTTGDAAGQNMVGRATFAACSWILEQATTVRRFYLESNLATDKKASQVNVMRTRGKRVTAEAVVPRDVLVQHMRVEPEALDYHSRVANVGSILSGANNNGAHSPNGITALFIATGQDVANVSESSAGIFYSELTPDGDLYLSITIPSLIVATHGGGTGLATQRECLELLGCVGPERVRKLAEIVAGVVLAGELSLGAAISSLDWVSSHERYGRNR
jgi:hydroxymethylglutaryl-CoA reductase (NADPH)